MSMAPFISNLYFNDQEGSILSYTKPDATIKEQSHHFVQTISIETTIPSHDESHPAWDYYLVESGGEPLLVRKPWYDILGNPVVRRVDTKSKELDMVRSIGNRALFLSGVRSLSINANKFQTIEGGCIYFVDPILTVRHCQASLVTIFHIADQVQNVMLNLDTMEGCSRPFTLAQAFAEYCIISPTE
jgi:hypothetical protein